MIKKVTIEELEAYLFDHVAIAALNGLNMNDIIIHKDRIASAKYNHRTNLEQFISNRRNVKVHNGGHI